MKTIKEAIKTDYGKLKYVIQLEQEGNNKLQLYIDNSNKLYFESNGYNFSNYPTFDLNDEAHNVAKEIFLIHLQAEVKTKIMELKQLELILEELGLKGVIRKSIEETTPSLLSQLKKAIKPKKNDKEVLD